MKTSTKTSLIPLLVLLFVTLSAASCTQKVNDAVWDTATYQEDTSVGSGSITFDVEVIAGEKKVTLTVRTDETNLEKALFDLQLIDGDAGAYGLYVKKVNGITADYDTDGSYWALSQSGEILMTSAGGVTLSGGEHFEFTYTK